MPWKPLLVCALTALVGLGLGAVAGEAKAQAPKRILVLYDEDKDNFPGLATIDRSLRESFRSALGNAVEIHSESLGLSRSGIAGYDARVADFQRSKYAGSPPDLIVAALEPPLDYLLRHADATFPGVPIVICGVDAATIKDKRLPPNFTGVLLQRAYSPTLEVALRLQPETRNVFVVGGAASFDRYLQAFVRRDLQPFEGRVAVTYLFGLPMDETLKRLSSLPARSVILYVTVFADGAGRRFVPHEVVSSIARAANAPVYVFLDQFVGLGAVGGNVYSTDTLGAEVARLGTQILRGASPASLPIHAPAAQVDLFDARQLRRWNLDEARLPPGSVVLHRDPSAWALYHWYIMATLAVVVLQTALIGGLLLARARQRRAETEARRQRDDLAHVLRVTTLGELSSSVAHEISQPLGAILLNAQAAQSALGSDPPADAKYLGDALADIEMSADYASQVVARLRRLSRKENVEPAAVDIRTTIGNVVRLLRAAKLVEGIDIRLALGDVPAVFGDAVQLEQVLLNIVINACDAINASDGGLRAITIQARRAPPHVLVEVIDTGIGVKGPDMERMFEHFVSTKPKGLGMGLAISRSIVTSHGGLLWATVNPDRGLTMHIELVAWVSDTHGGSDTPARAIAAE